MSIDSDRQRLSEAKMLENIPRAPKLAEMNKMIDVYFSSFKSGNSNFDRSIAIHCALIPLDEVDRVLSSPSWDLLLTGGMPNASMYYEGGGKRVEYLRYGVTNQVEPLVFFAIFIDYMMTIWKYARSFAFSINFITTEKRINTSRLMRKAMNP